MTAVTRDDQSISDALLMMFQTLAILTSYRVSYSPT